MNTQQTSTFQRVVKKSIVDDVVRTLMINPHLGEIKMSDLAGVRVTKFYVHKQPMLLAYTYEAEQRVITLLTIGPHENFYRDLKSSSKGS